MFFFCNTHSVDSVFYQNKKQYTKNSKLKTEEMKCRECHLQNCFTVINNLALFASSG